MGETSKQRTARRNREKLTKKQPNKVKQLERLNKQIDERGWYLDPFTGEPRMRMK